MPYCNGCGRYIGNYSAYRHNMAGKGEVELCHQCKKWLERHPGDTAIPPTGSRFKSEGKRIRAFAAIYIISSFGLCVLGIALMITSKRFASGFLLLVGALSFFFIGLGIRRSSNREKL